MTDGFRLALIAFVLSLSASICPATAAFASPCSDASAARQVARTISAIRQAEGRRQCHVGVGFLSGFFDGCRSLAYQRQQLTRDLAYLRQSGKACERNDEGRSTARRRNRSETREEADRRSDSSSERVTRATSSDGATRMYCVRKTDGYFFPAPNSQFAGTDTYDETLARCQFICDDQKMDVYFLPNAADETDDLVSISDRSAYDALPNAFRYQKAHNFKSCDMQRYYRRMQAIEKARAKPIREAKAGDHNNGSAYIPPVIVTPRAKPERLADGSFPVTTLDAPGARHVRIIGAPFLPEMRVLVGPIRR